MIKWMVIEYMKGYDSVEIIELGLSNIQTAEAERTMYLEDNPDVSADNVSVVMYKE